MLKSAFTDHPASVGETYGQHMGMAFGFAGRLFLASLACLIHGLLPFLFVRTGSAAIADLHLRMVSHRDRRSPDAGEATRAGLAPHGLG